MHVAYSLYHSLKLLYSLNWLRLPALFKHYIQFQWLYYYNHNRPNKPEEVLVGNTVSEEASRLYLEAQNKADEKLLKFNSLIP